MKFVILLGLAMLFNQFCYGKDWNVQVEKTSDSTSFVAEGFDDKDGGKISLDYSDSIAVAKFSMENLEGKEKIAFSIFNKKDGVRNSLAIKGKLPTDFSIVKSGNFGLKNSGSLSFAILSGSYGTPSEKRYEFEQRLYGIREELVSDFYVKQVKFGLKGGVDVVTADMSDNYGNLKNKWDNYGLRFGAYAKSQFSKNVFFQINADGWRKKYNPEKYFFVERWASETKVLSETTFLVNKNVELIPLLGYRRFNLERDGRVDLEELQYGSRFVYKTNNHADTKLYLNTIRALKLCGRGSETLVAVGTESNGLSVEVYYRQNIDSYSTFAIKDSMSAVSISWKFGGRPKDLESYKSLSEKHSFYLSSGSGDVKKLTLKQQAERLGTIRKQSEWELNLLYASEPLTGFRHAQEVYDGRAGDCDEQACLNATMETLNGYKTYVISWYDFGKHLPVGHAARIVKDFTNNQWFFVEYGRVFKINVPAGASPENAAVVAVEQNHMFTALVLDKPVDARVIVSDCSDGQGRKYINGYIPLKNVSSDTRRPNIEYGSELFVGRDFLFD